MQRKKHDRSLPILLEFRHVRGRDGILLSSPWPYVLFKKLCNWSSKSLQELRSAMGRKLLKLNEQNELLWVSVKQKDGSVNEFVVNMCVVSEGLDA